MIDISLLRSNDRLFFKKQILLKEPSFNIEKMLELDTKLREIRACVEELQATKNKLSKIKGAPSAEIKEKSISVGLALKEKTENLNILTAQFEELALRCPNIPHADVPPGDKESNKIVKSWGKKPSFNYIPKNHLELNENLDWFDLTIGTKIAGGQFVFYNEFGTKLTYALTRIMLKNNVEHGYTPVTPPLMANKESLLRNGSLPKFEGDFYSVEQENLSLIPTAEVALTSLHANKTYSADELPKRNTAWTSCFRREAGGYGATERGLIRVHQFEKVEIYSVTTPEESEKELEKIVQTAEGLLQKLEIPYRISLLAAKDTSFVSSKTFDLEVWLPGQDSFYEISSCSNCTDFQARRAKIRVKTTEEKKSRFAHTLNGSSLSIPRLIVALMENYQQQDGSIKLPNVLQKEIDSLW